MTLLIDNRTNFELTDEIKETLEKVCLKSLQYEEFNEDCEISLSIVTNDEIHDINKQFRNIDSPTDVLSFPQLTFEEGEEADVNENGEIVLGDIIISIDRAKEQAEEYGHSLKRELAFLSVHSMLHLMGYDHMVPEEEEDMFRRQKEILIEAGSHEQLLILLRCLGQRIEFSFKFSTGNKIVSGALGRRSTQDRGLDLQKSQVRHLLTQITDHLGTKYNVVLYFCISKVKITIF